MYSGNLKNNYRKSLEFSFIAVLLLLCLFFFVSRKANLKPAHIPSIKLREMIVVDVPRTMHPFLKKKQMPSRPSIPVASEELDFLEEVQISIEELDNMFSEPGETSAIAYTPTILPRQIVEVLPAKDEPKISGKLLLSLKISKRGKVIAHKVITNSINNTIQVRKIIQAIYKSKWQPAIIKGKKVDFWVDKSYSFSN